jgi:preprotein translocase subunit SecA
MVLSEAKKLLKEGKTKEGGVLLLRAYRSLPKNKALIKFLSEEGIRQLLQKRRTNTWQITIAKCIRLMKHCIL